MKRKREVDEKEEIPEQPVEKKKKISRRNMKIDIIIMLQTTYRNIILKKINNNQISNEKISILNVTGNNIQDELIEKIFPESQKKEKYFRNSFLQVLMNIKKRHLHKLIESYRKKDEINPKFLAEKCNWVFCKVFDITFDKEKRLIESENLKQTGDISNWLIDICGYLIPFDVFRIVLSYCLKNLEFLNSVGLVNENFYLMCLISWEYVNVTNNNCLKIPLLVLRNTKFLSIHLSEKFYIKNIRNIFENVKKTCLSIVVHGNFQKFFTSIRRRPCIKLQIRTLSFKGCNSGDFNNFSSSSQNVEKKKIKLEKSFSVPYLVPKLSVLMIPFISFNLKKYEIFKNITELVLLKSNSYSYETPNLKIPEFIINLKNLESLSIKNNMEESLLKGIEQMKFLKKLDVEFRSKKFYGYFRSNSNNEEVNFEVIVKQVDKYIFARDNNLRELNLKISYELTNQMSQVLGTVSNLKNLQFLFICFSSVVDNVAEPISKILSNIDTSLSLRNVILGISRVSVKQNQEIEKIIQDFNRKSKIRVRFKRFVDQTIVHSTVQVKLENSVFNILRILNINTSN